MGVFSKIRSVFPPSSRSFHAFYTDYNEARAEMHEEMERLHDEIGRVSWQLDCAHDRIGELEGRMVKMKDDIRAADAHLAHYAWQAMRREGETVEDARSRFFKEMPKATGGSRLLQDALVQLFCGFDELCRKNDIDYWMAFGTLLGAIRHEGFIPWDDDLDVVMPRAELLRLIDLVKDSDRYRITIRYDWHVRCRQIRFFYANPESPCFIDLFPIDYVTENPVKAFWEMNGRREAAIARMAENEHICSVWSHEKKFVDHYTEDGALISSYFDGLIEEARAQGLIVDNAEDAVGVITGIDNLFGPGDYNFAVDIDDLLPTCRLPFEGHAFNAPRNGMLLLHRQFGNIYTLPFDILTHYQHVEDDVLDSSEFATATIAAMESERAFNGG